MDVGLEFFDVCEGEVKDVLVKDALLVGGAGLADLGKPARARLGSRNECSGKFAELEIKSEPCSSPRPAHQTLVG